MQTSTPVATEANPFALMMDPQSVIAAMERLERSTHAQRRICRPLDKPTPVKPGIADMTPDSFIDAD